MCSASAAALGANPGTERPTPIIKDPQFVRLIAQLRDKERCFPKEEHVWRIVSDVHAAAIKATCMNRRLGQGGLRPFLRQPGCLCGKTARSYIKWLKRRCRSGDRSASLIGSNSMNIVFGSNSLTLGRSIDSRDMLRIQFLVLGIPARTRTGILGLGNQCSIHLSYRDIYPKIGPNLVHGLSPKCKKGIK